MSTRMIVLLVIVFIEFSLYVLVTCTMVMTLPVFPAFDAADKEQSAEIRWEKWIEKFENMITDLNINNDKCKKALFLHYCVEDTYDVFDSFNYE